MKRLLTIAFIFAFFHANSYCFEVDGINYKALSSNTAQVIPISSSGGGSSEISIGINYGYSGDVVIPETINYNGSTYQVVSAEDDVFASSAKMTSISLPSSLTELGPSPFACCSKLMSITVDPNNPVYTSDNGVLYDKDKHTLIAVPGGLSGSFIVPTSVTAIANSAFYGCFRLTSISIPESVSDIGANAFRACTSLATVNLPEQITAIKYGTFHGCSTLKTISIPSGVELIDDYAFYYCRNLQDLQLPSALTQIGEYAFCTCNLLRTVTIPEGVKSIGQRAFESSKSLAKIALPSSLEEIGAGIFKGCTSLLSIDLSSSNTHFIVEDGVLLDINKTTLICCPGGRKGKYELPSTVKVIEEYAFYNCKGLTSIVLPEGLTTIRTASFTYCSLLDKIILPSTVKTIGKSAFVGCSGLQAFVSRSHTPPIITSEAFSTDTYSLPLYVVGTSILLYQNADYWKNFGIMKLMGDVNQDGRISVVDVMILVNSITGNDSEAAPFEITLGDINNDGQLSVVDVMMLVELIML